MEKLKRRKCEIGSEGEEERGTEREGEGGRDREKEEERRTEREGEGNRDREREEERDHLVGETYSSMLWHSGL